MPTQSDTVYAFGPYVLDVDRRALTCEGQPVALAPKTLVSGTLATCLSGAIVGMLTWS